MKFLKTTSFKKKIIQYLNSKEDIHISEDDIVIKINNNVIDISYKDEFNFKGLGMFLLNFDKSITSVVTNSKGSYTIYINQKTLQNSEGLSN